MSEESGSGADEVRHYLKRLVIVIVCGALLMVIVAVVAWFTFARDFQEIERRAPIVLDAGIYVPPPR